MNNTVRSTFIIDKPSIDYINSNRHYYADFLVDKIIDVDNDESSFCVGINGNWGSGKTTFINCMRKRLEDKKCIVRNFNPWIYINNEKITQDFFKMLSNAISPYNKSISEPMLQYSEAFEAIGVPSGISAVISKFTDKHFKDINTLKDEITDILKSQRISVYILLDDIDRMEADEILEIFKLIRNTADFPYLKYILAYDKHHVESQLKTKDIEISYMEKIVSAEFVLPRINNYESIKVHIWKIVNNFVGVDLDVNFIHKLTANDLSLIKNALHNFRGIRNFARVFAFDSAFVKKTFKEKDDILNMEDFFWIELLRIYDNDLYEILRSNPNQIFILMKTSKNVQHYALKKDIELKHTLSRQILLKLLNHKGNKVRSNNRFFYLEYYSNYFTLEQEDYKITNSEFNSLLKKNCLFDEILEHVLIWHLENKSFSLYRHLLLYQKFGEGTSKSLINVALAFILVNTNFNDSYVRDIVKSIFSSKEYKSQLHDKLQVFLFNTIKYIIEEKEFHTRVPLILSIMLEHLDERTSNVDSYCKFYLFNEEDCTILLKLNIDKALRKNIYDASDIFNESSDLSKIVFNSSYFLDYREMTIFEQPIFDNLIDYFSEHKSNNLTSCKEFETLDCDDDEHTEYLYECIDKLQYKYNKYFGGKDKFNQFVDKCFNK